MHKEGSQDLSLNRVFENPVFTNVVAGDDFYDRMIRAATEARERLKLHCGPFAMSAVRAVGIGRDTELDEFTKDGITIMDYFMTNTPEGSFIKRLLTFVGNRVDSVCHDGTTTSMMLFASLVAEVLRHAQSISDDRRLAVSKQVYRLIEKFEEIIRDATLDVSGIHDLVSSVSSKQTRLQTEYAVAYHQALVAAKGDRELAQAVAEVATSMPVEMFGSYKINNTVLETDQRFFVDVQDYDYGFRSNIGNQDFYNQAFKTELAFPEADMIFTSVKLVKGNPYSSFIKALLSSTEVLERMDKDGSLGRYLTPDDDRSYFNMEYGTNLITRPLIIFSPETSDPGIIEMIKVHRKVHPDAPVVYASFQADVNILYIYENAISSMCGVPPLQGSVIAGNPMDSIIRGISVEHKFHFCKLRNLYKKDGGVVHPFYQDPEKNHLYTEVVSWIKNTIEHNNDAHAKRFNESVIDDLIALYRTMVCQSVKDLRVGGTSHEVAANISVATDANGAAVSALTDGIVMGGYPRLAAFLQEEISVIEEVWDDAEPPQPVAEQLAVYKLALDALMHLLYAIFRFTDKKAFLRSVVGNDAIDTYLTPKQDHAGNYIASPQAKAVRMKTWVRFMRKPGESTNVVLMQPVVGYREQFRRMKDVLPKLINSACLMEGEQVI